MRELGSLIFWRRNFTYLIVFAPQCLMPAVLVSLATILLTVGNINFYSQLSRGLLNINDLLKNIVVCLLATGVGLMMLIVGFTRWLFILTVFCRYWFCLELAERPFASRDTLRQRLAEAFEAIKSRNNLLTNFWLHLLVIMILPILILYVLAAVKMVASPKLMGGALITLPAPLDACLLPLCALISLFILIVSFLSLPVAAFSKTSPKQAVNLVLSLAKGKLTSVLFLTIAVCLCNILLGSPITLWGLSIQKGPYLSDQAVKLFLGQEVWQGLLSIVLLPLSLVPFCRLLKDCAHEFI